MSVFEDSLSTSESLAAFSDRNLVEAMLRFEAALARAQARCGLIPESAAHSIAGSCKVELFDVVKIVRDSQRAGGIAVPLQKALKEAVGLFNADALPFVLFGCSEQDLVDSAMALVTRQALTLIRSDLARAAQALLEQAECHAATPILARSRLRPASVTSFGLKCADWAAPLVRSHGRLAEAAERALQIQLGGAVGTLAEMRGQGAEVRRQVAAALDLADPGAAWHTQRDEWVALACELGLMVGSLGKMAGDIALLGQYEVGEVGEVGEPSEAVESADPGRAIGPAAAHRRVPLASIAALAAAQRVPQRVAALLAAMPQEHERGLGGWQAELAEWPALLMSAHGAVRALATVLPALQVDTARMRANIDRLRAELPRAVADESFDPGLAEVASGIALAQVLALRARLG